MKTDNKKLHSVINNPVKIQFFKHSFVLLMVITESRKRTATFSS
jgi:hypothetical protein